MFSVRIVSTRILASSSLIIYLLLQESCSLEFQNSKCHIKLDNNTQHHKSRINVHSQLCDPSWGEAACLRHYHINLTGKRSGLPITLHQIRATLSKANCWRYGYSKFKLCQRGTSMTAVFQDVGRRPQINKMAFGAGTGCQITET